MKIYLAGGMHAPWRADVIQGITEYFEDFGHKPPEFIDPCVWNTDDETVYTRKDLDAIDEADVVLGRMTRDNPSGYGLCVEVGYAFGTDTPIVWWQDALSERDRYFGMCRAMSTLQVHSLGEAARAMLRVL